MENRATGCPASAQEPWFDVSPCHKLLVVDLPGGDGLGMPGDLGLLPAGDWRRQQQKQRALDRFDHLALAPDGLRDPTQLPRVPAIVAVEHQCLLLLVPTVAAVAGNNQRAALKRDARPGAVAYQRRWGFLTCRVTSTGLPPGSCGPGHWTEQHPGAMFVNAVHMNRTSLAEHIR